MITDQGLLIQLSTKVFCTSGIVVVEQERATQKNRRRACGQKQKGTLQIHLYSGIWDKVEKLYIDALLHYSSLDQ